MGFQTFVIHSRDVYNFIGITLVAPLSLIFCNYRSFQQQQKRFSDFGDSEQLL